LYAAIGTVVRSCSTSDSWKTTALSTARIATFNSRPNVTNACVRSSGIVSMHYTTNIIRPVLPVLIAVNRLEIRHFFSKPENHIAKKIGTNYIPRNVSRANSQSMRAIDGSKHSAPHITAIVSRARSVAKISKAKVSTQKRDCHSANNMHRSMIIGIIMRRRRLIRNHNPPYYRRHVSHQL